jgi:hypothetical protein
MSDKQNKEQSKEKKSTYYPNSQKRYGEKCKVFAIKYLPDDMEKVQLIDEAMKQSGLSANAWIKSAIDEKLEREGFL